MEQYGILSPVLGIQEAMPSILLNDANFPEMTNARFYNGEVWRVRGRAAELKDGDDVKVQAPDGNPIIHYHYYLKRATGSAYLLVFTKANVYYWNPIALEFTSVFECSEDCDMWSTAGYNDKVIATNNVDFVQEWSGNVSAGFTALDDTTDGIEYGSSIYLTAAKFVTTFQNFLILGYTTENGVIYRKRIRWNAIGDESSWNTGDAGSAELAGNDDITGFAKRQDRLFVFKQDSIIQFWAVSTDLVFNGSIYSPNYGCPAPKSIVETPEGHIFYYASDRTFKEIDGTEISKPVNKTLTQIPANLTEGIEGKYSWDNRVVLWAYPEGPVEENNRVFTYDHLANRWGKESKHVNAFGEYKSGAIVYTWTTLPYDTWLTWDWDMWMWTGGQEGVPILLSGDKDGYTFSYYGGELDDGASYDGHFILSTDLRQGETLSFYKRLLFMQIYVRKEAAGGTITVEIKTDTEPNWMSAGSISLAGTEDILIKTLPVNSRGKTFEIKFSGSSRFRFLGAIFEYEGIGGR